MPSKQSREIQCHSSSVWALQTPLWKIVSFCTFSGIDQNSKIQNLEGYSVGGVQQENESLRKGEGFVMKRGRKKGLYQKFKAAFYRPKFPKFKNFINFIFLRDSLYLKGLQKAQFSASLVLFLFPWTFCKVKS